MALKPEKLNQRMLQRFQEELASSGLVPPNSKVLLGYSGGADSTCLLHLLLGTGVDVVAAHLHHSQRAEADEELLNCERVCKSLAVPFLSGKADVPAIAKSRKIGLEEAGRNARYEFFRMAEKQAGCNLIATAHTRTDLVETVLLNLARGAELGGIAGIPKKRGHIIRPLLCFTREETRRYCKEAGIWTHDDPANEDVSFSRARIRHRVIPELESINPAAVAAISRLSATAGEEDRFLDAAAAAGLEACEIPLNGKLRFLTLDCEAAFDRAKLLHLPEVLLRRAIRLIVESLGGSWDHSQTQAIVAAIRSDGKGSFTSEGGNVVLEWSDKLVHGRELAEIGPFRFPLTLPGETDGETLGWTFSARYVNDPTIGTKRDDLEVDLDPKGIRAPLYFRTAQPGDRMRPKGFKGERKLSDLLSEAKLTLAARKRLPIVCDMIGPIWAPGVCVEARVVVASEKKDPKRTAKQTSGELSSVENTGETALRLGFRSRELEL